MNYDRMVAGHVNRFGISFSSLWLLPLHWRSVGMESAKEGRFGMDTIRYCTLTCIPARIAWVIGRVRLRVSTYMPHWALYMYDSKSEHRSQHCSDPSLSLTYTS